MLGDEGGDEPRREIFGGRHHRDRQPAAAPLTQILHRLQHVAHRALDRRDMAESRLAGGVELEAERRAREQGDPHRILQALHARRQRSRRHVEPLRRRDQRAGLCDGEQGLQLRESDRAGPGKLEG